MSVNEPRDHFSKRMRLGTKSCAECRRRKVRCTFPPNSQNCKECLAHNTTCLSQGRAEAEIANQGNLIEMQRRLDGLEDLVRQLSRSITPQTKELESRRERIGRIGSPCHQHQIILNQSEGENYAYSQRTSQLGRSASNVYASPSGQEMSLEQAPLVGLLKDRLSIQQDVQETGSIWMKENSESRVGEEIKELKMLVPRLDELIRILELTEKYWHIWPVAFVTRDGSGHQSREDRICLARDLILESLESNNQILIAKTCIWLALCVQQLPLDVTRGRNNFSVSFNALYRSSLSRIQNLLTAGAGLMTSHELAECLLLQAKLHINMGKSGQAWLNVRNALNIALLQGLHRPDRCRKTNQNLLWTQIWQLDRNLSLILGVPYAISDSHISVTQNDQNYTEEQRLAYQIAEISGHVIDRNLHGAETNDPATARISREIQDCRDGASQDWWDEKMGPDTPFETLYSRQTLKMCFYTLGKMLYIPYMFTSSKSPENIPYRMAAVAASRNLVECYQILRSSSQTAIVMCDLMDFLVFSGALVIVMDLLSRRSSHETGEDIEDWKLIKKLINTFKHLSGALECTVASQAGELLNFLHKAHEGTYHNPDGYKAVIPLFGKVSIQSVPTRHEIGNPAVLDVSTEIPWLNTIEFGIHSPTEGLASTFPSDIEVDIDWTSFGDFNMDTDCTQIFHGAEYEETGY